MDAVESGFGMCGTEHCDGTIGLREVLMNLENP